MDRLPPYVPRSLTRLALWLAVGNLVIAAATMQPLSGPALVRAMRHRLSGQLALVPAMVMSARARPALVEESLRAGAHQVLVLPISASTLYHYRVKSRDAAGNLATSADFTFTTSPPPDTAAPRGGWRAAWFEASTRRA